MFIDSNMEQMYTNAYREMEPWTGCADGIMVHNSVCECVVCRLVCFGLSEMCESGTDDGFLENP